MREKRFLTLDFFRRKEVKMNRKKIMYIWIVLLVASSCAISRKENERIEKLVSQQASKVEIPIVDSLTQDMLSKYENRAIQKLEDLYDYLGLLGNANYGLSMKEEIKISAKELFFDPVVEINPFDSIELEKSPLITCLERQQNMAVEDFSISSVEIDESLKLESKNNYEGQISYFLMIGKDEDGVQIRKKANFSLRKIEKNIGNDSVKIWEVFLESIN